MAKKKKVDNSNTIASNRKARHDFFLEEEFEAGLSLQGWEVKSMREGRAQLKESYVVVHRGELYIIGAHITPLNTASTHVDPDPTRRRKLLLHRREIDQLIGAIERKGFTLVPVSLYWKRGRAKAKIALAKGKKQYDKRETIKKREWERDQSRMMKS